MEWKCTCSKMFHGLPVGLPVGLPAGSPVGSPVGLGAITVPPSDIQYGYDPV